ncbi:MAG: C40 family peptidase [Oscillospiraceae bacterium]|nr:C40 family peptidase [Oscillospiraceae bacterium]
MKRSTRIVSLVLTIFLFVSTFSVHASAAGTELKTGIAFVDASSLRLRAKPSTGSKTLDYAYDNEVVVLLGKSGEWYKVSYNLQTGYMHSKYLDAATKENAELGYGRITGNKVNVRSGPGTGYKSLDSASIGDKTYIIGINNKWFKVIYGDTVGYIRSDYVELTEIPYENRASSKSPVFFRGSKSTGITPSAYALKNTKPTASVIIATAKKYIGVPYVWGGSTPGGFDCSGFVQYVFNAHGISLPRTSKEQYSVGTKVSKSNLKAGDLVFFDTEGNGVSHLGIYIGNNQFIHASTSKGVTITSLSNTYWAPRYYGAKRIL